VLKGLVPNMALLRGSGNFKRWGIVGGVLVIGALEGDCGTPAPPSPFLFLFMR
jgi:hypothetical protein